MDDLQAKAKTDYQSGVGPTEISKKYNISLNTVKSWIRRWKQKEGAPSATRGAPSSQPRVHPEERATSPPVALIDIEASEPDKTNLTPKQRRFVEEYLIDLNATQAAIRAGYSAKNADKIGSELLGKTRVAEAIARGKAAISERNHIDQDWVLSRLIRLADYNLREFANLATVKRIFETKSGDVLEDEIQTVVLNPEFDGSIAKALFQDKDGIKLEMPDRLRALELIGKHIGMFSDPHRKRIDEQRMQLDRERLEIEKVKANKDSLNNDLVIKVKLPEVIRDADNRG